ncbi:MAG: hypothetical protein PHV59_08010 [Victivallales bacterium]|nr:hypothetical protein [Victivallales bacterium]
MMKKQLTQSATMPLLSGKSRFRAQITLAAAALMTGAAVCSGDRQSEDFFSTKSGTVIAFGKFDRQYYDTLQYLKYADRQISALVNSSAVKKPLPCKLFILDEEVRGNINIVKVGDSVSIYLNRNFRNCPEKFAVITALIRAMLLAKTGFDPAAVEFTVPHWLSVGIYGRLNLRFSSHSILPITYYPGLKALCQAEKLPDFRLSVLTSLDPDRDGTAYLLYEELCRFLLAEMRRLSSRADNPVADAIFLNARGKYSAAEIFDYTVGRAVAGNYDKSRRRSDRGYDSNTVAIAEKLQQWFQDTAARRLINPASPLATDYFVKRFYKFRRFTYVRKARNKAAVAVTRDISNITAIYDQYGPGVEFDRMRDVKLRELDRLIFVSQPLCVEYLNKLRDILNDFDKMPSTLIRKRLVRVLSDLEQTLEKQKKLENYLREVEYGNVSYGYMYRNELIESQRLQNNFSPVVSVYLDEVEKSFLKD